MNPLIGLSKPTLRDLVHLPLVGGPCRHRRMPPVQLTQAAVVSEGYWRFVYPFARSLCGTHRPGQEQSSDEGFVLGKCCPLTKRSHGTRADQAEHVDRRFNRALKIWPWRGRSIAGKVARNFEERLHFGHLVDPGDHEAEGKRPRPHGHTYAAPNRLTSLVVYGSEGDFACNLDVMLQLDAVYGCTLYETVAFGHGKTIQRVGCLSRVREEVLRHGRDFGRLTYRDFTKAAEGTSGGASYRA